MHAVLAAPAAVATVGASQVGGQAALHAEQTGRAAGLGWLSGGQGWRRVRRDPWAAPQVQPADVSNLRSIAPSMRRPVEERGGLHQSIDGLEAIRLGTIRHVSRH